VSSISTPPSLPTDQLRATAAAARVSLVVSHAPTPPGASRREVEAGREAMKQAQAEAEAAHQKVRDDRAMSTRRGVVV
jgi:hypothetical protein